MGKHQFTENKKKVEKKNKKQKNFQHARTNR